QFGGLVEERVEVLGRVVAAGQGGLGPAAVLAHVPDKPVHQGELAGDPPGPSLVQRGTVLRAKAVVIGLTQVDRDRAAPPLPAGARSVTSSMIPASASTRRW